MTFQEPTIVDKEPIKKTNKFSIKLACVLDTLVFSTIFQGLVDFLGFDHRINGDKKPKQEVNQNKI